jgi:hypothetical protein
MDWDPSGDEQPGSLQAFGRELRTRFGGQFAGLDNVMVSLLEQLFRVPGVTGGESEEPDQAQAPALALREPTRIGPTEDAALLFVRSRPHDPCWSPLGRLANRSCVWWSWTEDRAG